MGTQEGGISTAETNRKRHGSDFYSRIGAAGGRKKTEATARKGYGSNRALASESGKIGGAVSRKTPVFA